MSRFFGSLITMAIGFLVVWKTNWIYENFGQMPLFGTKFASSSPRFGWKILGIIFLLVGILWLTGLYEVVLTRVAEKLSGN